MIGFASASRRVVPLIAVALLLAGCAAADKTAAPATTSSSASASSSGSSSSNGMSMNMGGTSSAGSGGSSAASAELKAAGAAADGIKPVPTQILATATWQGMKITAQAMTPVPFVIFNGTSEQMVKPGPKTSFHLMVMLNDAHTGVPIPYASVWATIAKQGKIVYDERQWPMISEYMGPHYGNDVSVPGAGTYQLTLLISPPVSARHVEYQNVWLKPHRVSLPFRWQPTS
jgi:uncharacterized protein involved in high-affinity Fe2+ transport